MPESLRGKDVFALTASKVKDINLAMAITPVVKKKNKLSGTSPEP